MQKILKNNKGSITLFVTLSVLFFLVVVTSVAVSLKNKETAVDAYYERIKSIYEKDVGYEDSIINLEEDGNNEENNGENE